MACKEYSPVFTVTKLACFGCILRCWLAVELTLPCKHLLGLQQTANNALLQRSMELQLQLTASYLLAFFGVTSRATSRLLCGVCSAEGKTLQGFQEQNALGSLCKQLSLHFVLGTLRSEVFCTCKCLLLNETSTSIRSQPRQTAGHAE